MSISVQVFERLQGPNLREDWRTRHKRDKRQRTLMRISLNAHKRPSLPCVITLLRYGKRVMDYDNLVSAFKGIRDEVADYILPGLKAGRADADPRMEFRYEQAIARDYSIVVTVDPLSNSSVPVGR